MKGDHIVKTKGEFTIIFNAETQTYRVLKAGKIIVKDKYKYIQVKSYVE